MMLANILKNSAKSSDRSFSTGQDLARLLDREIVEEEKNINEKIPVVMAGLVQSLESDWRIVHGKLGSMVRMYKKQPLGNGSKVVVEFRCKENRKIEYCKGLFLDPQFTFVVSVQKASQCMLVVCSSLRQKFTIEGFQTQDVANGESAAKKIEDLVLYELGDDLKQSLFDFVQTECGVSSDMAVFITMYADYQKLTNYMEWLQNVRKILS